MTYGSNEGVESAERDYREECAGIIAEIAARLVAAKDMSRDKAIREATAWVRNEIPADSDPTGVASIQNAFPLPSGESSTAQVASIASELLDSARDAADSL